MLKRILVVDDEKSIRSTLREILEFEGHQVSEAEDGDVAIKKILQEQFDCILCDIKMPKSDGIDVLNKVTEYSPQTPIVMISGHGTIETAVEAVKKGAFDYISKPPDLNRLLATLRSALAHGSNGNGRASLPGMGPFPRSKSTSKKYEIIGNSPSLKTALKLADKVAATDARVLITGENGTGKELLAHRIFELSQRSNNAFVEVNCAAIPSELIESELFGHEKGSFTSAVKQRIGKFEQASGGTLFMDEIGDMSLSAQAKVLRALQERKITRVGGEKDISVDVRVIAATNKNIKKEIEDGRFREDLYHRLGVILIRMPSLSERLDDIPLLTRHFIKKICEDYGMPVKEVEDEALTQLTHYPWTGNVRELRNVIERLVILSDTFISKNDVINYIETH